MKKKYLIVAIEKYNKNRYKSLQGVLNAAVNWEKKLQDIGFEGISLYNEFATRENFISNFKNIKTSLNQNDIFSFIFIGHGDNQNSSDPNESDNKDELLVLYDYNFLDNGIRELLDSDSIKPFTYIILDCCYNGVIEHKSKFRFQNNEVIISSASHFHKAYGIKFIDGYSPVFSYYASQFFDKNLSTIEWFNKIFDETKPRQTPNMLATNEEFLKYKIFSNIEKPSPIIEFHNYLEKLKDYIGNGQLFKVNNNLNQ